MFPPEEPTDSFPYRVVGRVGIGSMGVVYRAVEVDLDRTVAVKTLRPSVLAEEAEDVQQEMRRRFLQEAQAAGRVSHPGVTTVFRVGEEGGVPFMVMEWLNGETLDEMMRTRGRLPPMEAARWTADLLETLEAAHRVGVVHRDIKPSNLVIVDSGRLKVTDFGIARIQGRDLVQTQAGVVLATPKFASPEQLRGVEVDGRADIFATGVLLYHLLSGTYPFHGDSFMELANAILQHDPIPLSQLVPEVPKKLEAVVRMALRRQREDRYRAASLMAQDLRALLAQEGSSPVEIVAPDLQTAKTTPISRHLPRQPGAALAKLAAGWPGRNLQEQDTGDLLGRLLTRPLHAPAFSGALNLGEAWLFLHDGVLLGAVLWADGQEIEQGDTVVESLPARAAPSLHPLPEIFPKGLLPVLASILHPPRLLHADLDSSYINLPAMAQKLGDERFGGLLRLEHGGDWGAVAFVDGEPSLSFYSKGWASIPIDDTWQRWISAHPVRAQVEMKTVRPPAAWFRRAFKDLVFDVQVLDTAAADKDYSGDGSTSTRLRHFFSSSRRGPLSGKLATRLAAGESVEPLPGAGIQYEQAPAARFLDWVMGSLPRFFEERDLFGAWKYLAEWLLIVRRARLYHSLRRPSSAETDFFDAVTEDAKGKVLHLAHRQARPTPQSLRDFRDRVVAAKTARLKTGDVGGVFLIAPHFDDAVLAAYQEMIQTTASKSWFGVEESFTGYEGFVRIGPRRGFHLLLVEESADGFEPLLPRK